MGTCFSLTSSDQNPPPTTAKVVSINGTLREYNIPINVSSVLEAEAASSSASSFTSSFFLCNSDFLTYEDYIPELDSKANLYPNQLYFVLPRSKLQNRLTASDMAALAVKASVAIQNTAKKDGNRNRKSRISPVLALNVDDGEYLRFVEKQKEELRPLRQATPVIMRSRSVRRLQKYTSRRAKLAVRSFRLRLSTIYEGTVLNSTQLN
ncbi:uncharacterized protein [Euphorbia lathyris]|uniref:uncharacterized protein n=1 Tax=Euphorbia lathyris TaxID=212925 RepID=UPI0033135E6D